MPLVQDLNLVPDERRLALSLDPELGAGNFLKYAVAASPNPHAPILYLEKPFVSPLSMREQETLSLIELDEYSAFYARFYLEQGIVPKDLVAIYRDDSIDYLVHYLALVRIGAIGVLTNGNLEPSIAARYFRRVGVSGGFMDSSHLAAIRPYLAADDFSKFLTDVAVVNNPKSSLVDYTHADCDPIMIAHSSGTTGIPKPVLLQHAKFFYGNRQRLKVPRMVGGENILSSLPHSHNCAIAYIMLALLSGTPVFITSDHSGRNVLRAIKEFKPKMVVSFPQTYVELVGELPGDSDLKSVSLWFNGGDAAHEPHIRKLVSLGAPGSVFVDGMGSSEMGFSLFRNVHSKTSNRYQRCVGKPHDWVEAAVLSEDGKILPSGAVGRLGVKAESVTSGYWNDSQLTYKSILSGFFLTGDLAYKDDEGFIYHVDRVPDAINCGRGVIYSLETEEIILSMNPEVLDCSVVARDSSIGKEAVALLRLYDGALVDLSGILLRLNERLRTLGRGQLSEVLIVDREKIPLGTTGKVLKRKLREEAHTRSGDKL